MVDYPQHPLCPHCNQEIGAVKELLIGSNKVFYACPKCMKIISIGRP